MEADKEPTHTPKEEICERIITTVQKGGLTRNRRGPKRERANDQVKYRNPEK
jgi:hypothetical protein